MASRRPPKKIRKMLQSLVADGEDPGLANLAPVFLYPGDDLEILASLLNDVPPDSPHRFLANLIERLVTTSQAKEHWVRQAGGAPLIGPTPCSPAPESPLYELNMFLARNPCFLRIEGRLGASGDIDIHATHIPIPPLQAFGLGDKGLQERVQPDLAVDRIAWILWELFHQKRDLTRLKKCPMCHKWFVDHTKNKSKILCSNRACTNQKWSWDERQKKLKAKGVKHAKAKKA